MVPKNNQKIIKMQERLLLVGSITIRGAIMVKIKNIIPDNASFQGYFTKVNFETSEGNQLSYFFKMDIFSKFFRDVMSHIIR